MDVGDDRQVRVSAAEEEALTARCLGFEGGPGRIGFTGRHLKGGCGGLG